MNLERQPTVEFFWTADFERELTKRLLEYRLAEKRADHPVSRLEFERFLVTTFLQELRTLMTAAAPALAMDSDIEAAMSRLLEKRNASMDRERLRLGDNDFKRLYPGDAATL